MRGFAVVGIAASVVYGVTGALGMLSSAFHIIAAEKIGKQDERGFENAFAGSKILVILIGLTVVLVSILFGKPFFYATGKRITGASWVLLSGIIYRTAEYVDFSI